MRKYILVCLLMLVLSLYGSPSPEDYADFKGGKAGLIEQKIVVPFQITDSIHRIVVSPKFDGNELELIFDTGGQTFLEKSLKDSLGLESFTIPENQAEFSVINTIDLDGIEVYGMKVGLIEFNDTFKFDLSGMIGSDFLRFFQLMIDYEKLELTFSQPDQLLKVDEKDHIMDIEIIFPYFPTAAIQIGEDRSIPGLIDTGLHYAFVFPVSWIENLSADERSGLIEADGYFARWPWHEDPQNYLGVLQEIQLGDLVLQDVPVIFSEIPAFLSDSVALIGKFFLENYLTTIDYPNRQVNFREVKEPVYSLTYSSGIMLADKDDKLQITGVWHDSPAYEMGLSPADELVAVTGKRYGNINNKDIFDILMNPAIKEFEITILKDGIEMDLKLLKRELFE
jgi:hypothetical protein